MRKQLTRPIPAEGSLVGFAVRGVMGDQFAVAPVENACVEQHNSATAARRNFRRPIMGASTGKVNISKEIRMQTTTGKLHKWHMELAGGRGKSYILPEGGGRPETGVVSREFAPD